LFKRLEKTTNKALKRSQQITIKTASKKYGQVVVNYIFIELVRF